MPVILQGKLPPEERAVLPWYAKCNSHSLECLKWNNKTDNTAPPLNPEGVVLKDNVKKANCLNYYFKSIFTASSDDADCLYIPNIDTELMLLMELNVTGIEKLLVQLKVNKASGLSNIPPIFFKN